MKIELVIFDCDGTLIDSELIIADEEAAAYRDAGIDIDARTFLRRFAGLPEEAIRETLESESSRYLPDDFDKDVPAKIDDRLGREVEVIDGAHEMLDRLGLPRCICSNSADERLQIELRRTRLWDRFKPYVFSSRDLKGIDMKPAPDVFLHAASEFGAKPAACVVLEDSVPGVQAGVAAGMRTIGFTGGSHTYAGHADALTEAGAETVVKRLLDLPALIGALENWQGFESTN